MTVTENIREIVAKVLRMKGDTGRFSDSEPLVTTGRIDSLEVLQITVDLEAQFGVDLSRRPFDKYDFETVEAITAMVSELAKE